MELELWAEVSAAICAVSVKYKSNPYDQHSTALIVRVYHWACLHDRPLSWACKKKNWKPSTLPQVLPGQSTISRRTLRADFMEFLHHVAQRLNGKPKAAMVKVVDGKPLELPNHSSDRDATWSRGVSRTSLGYELHAVFSDNAMPDAWAITTLNVCEKKMAARMVKRLSGCGYLLSDAHFDARWLFDCCHEHSHQLVCPRAKPGTGQRHHYVSPHRRRAIDLLEMPTAVNCLGQELYKHRTHIERRFSGLVCFGGGLTVLPSWVRRIWRVRYWVMNKLLINAAHTRICSRESS